MQHIKDEIKLLTNEFLERIHEIIVELEKKEKLINHLNNELSQKNSELERRNADLKVTIKALQKQKGRLDYANLLFRTFMNNSPMLAWIKDEDFKYIYINKAFAKQYEVSQEGINQRTDFEIFPADIAEKLTKYDFEVQKYNKAFESIDDIKLKDGEYHFVHTFKFPIKHFKGKEYIAGLSIDITENKVQEKLIEDLQDKNVELAQQEEELVQFTEEMRVNQDSLERIVTELGERNEELDQFVYKISHDVRSPLATALGIIEIIEDLDDINEVKKYTKLGKERLNHLDNFLRGLLDFSRTQRMEQKIEDINLLKLIESCLDEQKYQKGYNQTKIIIDLPQEAIIQTKYLLLKTIFSNLISNAIRYQDKYKPNSFIKIKLDTLDSNNMNKIIIEDNGVGINADYLNNIFDMFYRANDYVKGTGLGLYIAKKAIEKLNGKIEVESELGKGTRFIIILP